MSNQPVGIEFAETRYELTDTRKAGIKSKFGTSVKKINLSSFDFVFKIASRAEWEEKMDTWRKKKSDANENITEEMFDKQLIDSFVVFPGNKDSDIGGEFSNLAEKILFWNELPAGVQPRLARYIEHYAGFFIQELSREEDLYAENIYEAVEAAPKPNEETLNQIKGQTDLPIKLIRFNNEWYALRAMKFSEAKNTRKKMVDNPDGDHEIKQLERCLLLGNTNFDDKPAGLVPVLLNFLKEVSGLGQENVFSVEAEDL